MPDQNHADLKSNSNENASAQGRMADKPHEIPKPGWKSILKRTKDDIGRDHLSTVAAGVGLFVLLGLVPALAALISIYGLVSNPAQIEHQFASFRHLVPDAVYQILSSQMKTIASSSKTAGWGAVIGILVSLWGGASGVKALIDGLNIAYHEREKRSFIKLNLTAVLLTLGGVVGLCLLIGVLGAVPVAVKAMHLNDTAQKVALALRWPVLFVCFLVALAVLYRYGPSRDEPKWRWINWGAVTAAALWLTASAAFAVYLTYFNSYNKTYGALGAMVILLLWLQLSAYSILLGAELNSEMELQTEKDTTRGRPQPRGWRGAYAADNLGESR